MKVRWSQFDDEPGKWHAWWYVDYTEHKRNVTAWVWEWYYWLSRNRDDPRPELEVDGGENDGNEEGRRQES